MTSPQIINIKKNPVGRPTAFRPEFVEAAYRFTKMGANRLQLAEQFGVADSVLHDWMNKFPDFDRAIRQTRLVADELVAAALYKRAVGYTKKVTKVFQHNGEVVLAQVDEEMPADVQAGRYWLNNRQPKLWAERQELTGAGGEPISVNLSWVQKRGVTIEAEDIEVKHVEILSSLPLEAG